ncbi:MAG: hypothetical protein ACUVXB_12785 [Bryobacteraceae bacterium]
MREDGGLRGRFMQAFSERVRLCLTEADYWPKQYLAAVRAIQDLEGVERLLHGPASEDSVQLWARSRLDLTVEALVCAPAWLSLFPARVIREAEARLREWNAVDPEAVVAALAQEAAHPLYGLEEIDWGE